MKVSARWDANTDRAEVTPERPLEALDFGLASFLGLKAHLRGNVVTISGRFVNLAHLKNTLTAIQFALPLFLNIDLVDAPVISQVSGKLSDEEFVWQYSRRQAAFDAVTVEIQQDRVAKAWGRIEPLAKKSRRLTAALHYLHMACRLERAGITPWEFMAESLLNYAKVLESLFPGPPGESIKSARKGLAGLGFSTDEVEANFIPAIALRNHVDVGHVFLAALTSDQLAVIHEYTERAEQYFRDLLDRALISAEAGDDETQGKSDASNREVSRILRRMEEARERQKRQ